MNKNIKIIRQCITARHGGMEAASDEQILTVWNALDAASQKQYLTEQEEKKGNADALSPGTRPND